jgi:hypothetical protein
MLKVAQPRRWRLRPPPVSEFRWMCLSCQRRLQHSAAAELPPDSEETRVRNTNFPPQRGRQIMHPPRTPRTYISREEKEVSQGRSTYRQFEFQRRPRSQPTFTNGMNVDQNIREPRETPTMDRRDVARVAEVRQAFNNSNK